MAEPPSRLALLALTIAEREMPSADLLQALKTPSDKTPADSWETELSSFCLQSRIYRRRQSIEVESLLTKRAPEVRPTINDNSQKENLDFGFCLSIDEMKLQKQKSEFIEPRADVNQGSKEPSSDWDPHKHWVDTFGKDASLESLRKKSVSVLQLLEGIR